MQTELVENCPICKGSKFENILTCTDNTFSHQDFQIQKCCGCKLLITNPRPNAHSIGDYYKSSAYISHSGKSKSIFDIIYFKARSVALRWKYKLITQHRQVGSILDYGCGTGEFLSHMYNQNWEVSGVEPSATAREKANHIIGKNQGSVVERLEDLAKEKFDVITLWHVLEHVPHPGLLLKELKLRLIDNGLIFVAIPNHESHDANYYGQHWAGYDVPRHFWHFTQTNIIELLTNEGFFLQQKMPMKMDAFYASLLSEQYKNNGRHNLLTPIKAMFRGLLSNAKGKKSMNYSSLIYIARHA